MFNINALSTDKDFINGTNCLLKKEYCNAIKYYNASKEKGNCSKELTHNLSIAYFKYGTDLLNNSLKNHDTNHEMIIEQFDNAIKHGYSIGEVYYNRGVSYLFAKEYGKAQENFDNAIKKDYTEAQCYYNLGITFSKLNNVNQAIESFSIALTKNPKDVDILFEYGHAQFTGGNYNESIDKFKLLLQQPSLDAFRKIDVYCRLTKAIKHASDLAKVNLNEQANEILTYLLEADKLLNHIEDSSNNGYAAYIYSHLGTIYLNKGNFQDAKNYLSKAHVINPDDIIIANNLSITLFQLIKHSVDAGEITEQSNDNYNPAIKLLQHANDNTSLNNLASMYLSIGEYDKAQETLSKLLGNDSETHTL